MEKNLIVAGDRNLPAKMTAAVAIKGGGGGRGGAGSRRAVRWAVENLMPNADRFVLIHVMPRIISIPTPSGVTIPIEKLDAHVVEMYRRDKRLASKEIFLPFKKLCKRKKIETLVLEGDNPASALLKYVTDSDQGLIARIQEIYIVLLYNLYHVFVYTQMVRHSFGGILHSNNMDRKPKDSTVPSAVLKNASKACNIYIVAKRKLITTSVTPLSTGESSSKHWWFSWRHCGSLRIYKLNGGHYAASVDCGVTESTSFVSDLSHLNSQRYPNHSGSFQERNNRISGISIPEIEALNDGRYSSSVDCEVKDTASSVSDHSRMNSQRFSHRFRSSQERNHQNSGNSILEINSGRNSSSVDCEVNDTAASVSDLSRRNSRRYSNHSGSRRKRNHQNSGNRVLEIEALNGGQCSSSVDCEVNDDSQRYPNHSGSLQERNHQNSGNSIHEIQTVNECSSVASTDTKQSDVPAEVEQLRLELMNTVGMYNRACEGLVHAPNKDHFLSSACLEEARQVNAALQRAEDYNKIAAEEKRKHLEAVKEIETARNLLAKEAYERQVAVLKSLKESMKKMEIVNTLFSNDRRYRRYTRDEIEMATDSFSETKLIGEGSYGKVYRCNLDKIPVAVKVLRSHAVEKIKEFLNEIEVLSQLCHPHIVLLLGACPEIGCLVFEYMENGSLEDFVSDESSRKPLPWFVRFRIAFEVACGLAFLHNSRPYPIIHRDLKPGNILLDRNYVSKIGDVGLAKLISDVTPDNITHYRDSTIFGTLHYVDPEYHRTGTVRPKSDLYAFGIIVLQLLAAQHPAGLLLKFETALSNGWLYAILDKSIPDWPLAEAEELAQMALRCSKLRCRDRPDLETEVLPLLKKLADMADASSKVQRNSIHAPSHYYCPILQEVMEDPHIAADGCTYEHRAIKAWLERHNLSPVTKRRLEHEVLIPNHTLRSAIEDWRSGITSSSG